MRAAYGARKAVRLARGKALDSQAAQLILEQFFDDKQAS
jgi:RNase H-fold protein (predicted Holliday junction resolvase)